MGSQKLDHLARALAGAQSRRQTLKLLFAGAVGGLLASVTRPASILLAQQQGATLTVLRGQVALIRPDGSAVQPAPSGITVRPGDEIRTLDAAGALITFFSGIEIELGEDTILVVENVSRDGDRVNVSLKQVLGTAVNRVQTLADPGSTYQVRVGGAVAVVRGTVYVPSVDGNNAVVGVWKGAVDLCIPDLRGVCALIRERQWAFWRYDGKTGTVLDRPTIEFMPNASSLRSEGAVINTVVDQIGDMPDSDGDDGTPAGSWNPGTDKSEGGDGGNSNEDGGGGGGDGGNQPCVAFVCGNTSCASRPSGSPPDCYCFERADAPGQGRCLGNFFCSSQSCTSSSQCPSGNTCVVNTCCGSQGLCAPACPASSQGVTLNSGVGGPTAGRR